MISSYVSKDDRTEVSSTVKLSDGTIRRLNFDSSNPNTCYEIINTIEEFCGYDMGKFIEDIFDSLLYDLSEGIAEYREETDTCNQELEDIEKIANDTLNDIDNLLNDIENKQMMNKRIAVKDIVKRIKDIRHDLWIEL